MASDQGAGSPGYIDRTQASILRRTKLCKWHRFGLCTWGGECNFAHSSKDINVKPDLRFTKPCPAFAATGRCDNSKCTFAHKKKRRPRCFGSILQCPGQQQTASKPLLRSASQLDGQHVSEVFLRSAGWVSHAQNPDNSADAQRTKTRFTSRIILDTPPTRPVARTDMALIAPTLLVTQKSHTSVKVGVVARTDASRGTNNVSLQTALHDAPPKILNNSELDLAASSRSSSDQPWDSVDGHQLLSPSYGTVYCAINAWPTMRSDIFRLPPGHLLQLLTASVPDVYED